MFSAAGGMNSTTTAFPPQGLPAPCGCCLGNGWGIMRNAWKLYSSVGLMDGVKGGGWLFSISFFYIEQIRQAGCCGDNMEEVSCTPAPQTRSPANTDLRNPKGVFSFFFFSADILPLFFPFFPMANAKKKAKRKGGGGCGRRGKRER